MAGICSYIILNVDTLESSRELHILHPIVLATPEIVSIHNKEIVANGGDFSISGI